MFYTLASKIPLIPSGKNHFLIVFVLGSLAYIALNYYLYTGQAPEFVDKFKTYVYYLMAIDLAIAYFLSKGTHSSENDEEEKGGYTKEQKAQIEKDLQSLRKSKQSQMDAYTQRALQMEQEQLVQAQYQKNKQRNGDHHEQSNDEESVAKSNQSPFKTIDEAEEDDRRENEARLSSAKNSKNSKNSRSSRKTETEDEESSDERPVKKVIKKVQPKAQPKKTKRRQADEDTDIPVYGV